MLLGKFCSAPLVCSGLDAAGPLPHSLVHTFVTPVCKDLPSALLGARYTVVMKTDLSFQPPRRFLPPRVPSPRLSENVASKAEPDTLMVAYLESLAGCRLLRAIVQATVVLSMQPSGNHITRHLEAAETPESVSLKLSYTVSLITLSVL